MILSTGQDLSDQIDFLALEAHVISVWSFQNLTRNQMCRLFQVPVFEIAPNFAICLLSRPRDPVSSKYNEFDDTGSLGDRQYSRWY